MPGSEMKQFSLSGGFVRAVVTAVVDLQQSEGIDSCLMPSGYPRWNGRLVGCDLSQRRKEKRPAVNGCFQRELYRRNYNGDLSTGAEVEAPQQPEVSRNREVAAQPCDCSNGAPRALRLPSSSLSSSPASAAVNWFVWSCYQGDGCIKMIITGFRHENHGKV